MAVTAVKAVLKPRLQLGEAVGLSRDELLSERHVLPGVRFAVDAYVNFDPQGQLAGSGVQFADRTVCPANSSVAPRQLAAALSMDQRRRLFLLPQPLSRANRDVEHGLELAKIYCDSAEKAEPDAGDPAV